MLPKKYLSLILIALCFLVYANSLNGAFICDDLTSIVNNPSVNNAAQYLFSPPGLLNSLNYLTGKLNPFSYHLTNMLLHSVNSVLAFIFLCLFFKTEAAFLGAGLFAAHPIHTEAVSWISGRPYCVLGFFIFAIYLLYRASSYGPDGQGRFRPGRYLCCLTMFAYFLPTI